MGIENSSEWELLAVPYLKLKLCFFKKTLEGDPSTKIQVQNAAIGLLPDAKLETRFHTDAEKLSLEIIFKIVNGLISQLWLTRYESVQKLRFAREPLKYFL